MGTEFKVVCDTVTGIMTHLEIQKGKDLMKDAEYVNTVILKTAACTSRLIKYTKGLAPPATIEEEEGQTVDTRVNYDHGEGLPDANPCDSLHQPSPLGVNTYP